MYCENNGSINFTNEIYKSQYLVLAPCISSDRVLSSVCNIL